MSSTNSAPPTQCKICDQSFESTRNLSSHLRHYHKVTSKWYYDKFHKGRFDSSCSVCTSQTQFISITEGYNKCCSIVCRDDPSRMGVRVKQFKDTLEKDPSIKINAIKKWRKTLKDDPTIMEKASIKMSETYKIKDQVKGLIVKAKEKIDEM